MSSPVTLIEDEGHLSLVCLKISVAYLWSLIESPGDLMMCDVDSDFSDF